ncbi:MAG: hypothetical protein JOS17DRAFT_771445 [Linnemannia elongata]|nr:MAG: hypothetical protein JOS17DRAFT_771445 [Linnemannia elongata]
MQSIQPPLGLGLLPVTPYSVANLVSPSTLWFFIQVLSPVDVKTYPHLPLAIPGLVYMHNPQEESRRKNKARVVRDHSPQAGSPCIPQIIEKSEEMGSEDAGYWVNSPALLCMVARKWYNFTIKCQPYEIELGSWADAFATVSAFKLPLIKYDYAYTSFWDISGKEAVLSSGLL